MEKKIDTWLVAMAVIYLESKGTNFKTHHYKEIAEDVINSKLTTLGEKGKTPHQTFKSILLNKKYESENVFVGKGESYYGLAVDPTSIPGFRVVLASYKEAEKNLRASFKQQIEGGQVKLEVENASLKKRITELENMLKKIQIITEGA